MPDLESCCTDFEVAHSSRPVHTYLRSGIFSLPDSSPAVYDHVISNGAEKLVHTDLIQIFPRSDGAWRHGGTAAVDGSTTGEVGEQCQDCAPASEGRV